MNALAKHSKAGECINTNIYRLWFKKWHQVIPLSRILGLLEWQTLELCSPNRLSQVLHGLAACRIFLSLSTPSGLKELSCLPEPRYGMHSFIGELYFLPPASEGWGKVMFSVCSHLGGGGGVPISHNALQHYPECHGAAGGVPCQV